MPTDPSKLTPEYLSSLTEEQQKELLEELKGELAKVQAKIKSQHRDVVKRLQRSIGRHEAQLAYLSGEIRKIDDLLGQGDQGVGEPEAKRALRTLILGRTFYRAGRKMLAIQMQDMRQDLSTLAIEITAPFAYDDPFVTYDYRRASAEADLACLQLLMIENERCFKLLAAALGVRTEPAAGEEPSGGGTAQLKKPLASREITEAPRRTVQGSALDLPEGLPPPPDLELKVPAAAPEPVVEVPPAPVAADDPEAAGKGAGPEAAGRDDGPALTPEEAFDVDYLKKAFADDPELGRRAAVIADHLREANGLISKGLEYMGHIATTPPAEGAKLLDLHFWNKLNGKVFYVRRLCDQVTDSPILAKLFPQTEKPTLPFEKAGAEPATRPIAMAPTDRLGLPD